MSIYMRGVLFSLLAHVLLVAIISAVILTHGSSQHFNTYFMACLWMAVFLPAGIFTFCFPCPECNQSIFVANHAMSWSIYPNKICKKCGRDHTR